MQIQLPSNLVCFSHLRWDFVYQRPQHLMSRFAAESVVYYVEEPIFEKDVVPAMVVSRRLDHLWVCVPHLPHGLSAEQINFNIHKLLVSMLADVDMSDCIFWYYTPMALKFSADFDPACIVYDCMDELSAFKFAPAELKRLERELMNAASVVFTGGHSLYEAKRHQHENIHPFPSSIDKQHFQQAREACECPADQACIEGFKLGFYGVIDERFDTDLIAQIATMRPEWQIVLIGPVVKIDPAMLPANPNIHYLGSKSYEMLPKYLAGWDVALIPFLLNESTVFISPTKTPEYLTAGKPVVSTAIRDVITGYGENGAVSIASNAEEFVEIIDGHVAQLPGAEWLEFVDGLLEDNSWDNTFKQMKALIIDSTKSTEIIELYRAKLPAQRSV
ncbi:glycosyltransferase family 1 protein [Dyadobacter crusticola]|uniref:glycosyltransferase family 1 protein n=1 Tax=Dyadobacter crusticola TaxID=292407 RepID=UPI00054D9193|nr:glycosyltransferase family 1 protein [Dyadobacter crusticola]